MVDVGWRLAVLLEPVSQHELEVSVAVDLDQAAVVVDLVEESGLVLVFPSLRSRPLFPHLACLAARFRAHRPEDSLRPARSLRKVLGVRLLRCRMRHIREMRLERFFGKRVP